MRTSAVNFLQDVVSDYNLLPAEQKLATQILRTLTTGGDEPNLVQRQAELEKILTPPTVRLRHTPLLYTVLSRMLIVLIVCVVEVDRVRQKKLV